MCEESYKAIKEYFGLHPIIIEAENQKEFSQVLNKTRTVEGAFKLGFTEFALFRPFTIRMK